MSYSLRWLIRLMIAIVMWMYTIRSTSPNLLLRLIILAWAFLLPSAAQALQPVAVESGFQEIRLGPQLDFILDDSDKMTLNDVRRTNAPWQPLGDGHCVVRF